MKKRKIKNTILGVLRLLPFTILLLLLLNAFRNGFNMFEHSSVGDGIYYLDEFFAQIVGYFVGYLPSWCGDIAYWFANNITNGNPYLDLAVIIGMYELIISMFVLFYNALSFVLNIGNKFLEDFEK